MTPDDPPQPTHWHRIDLSPSPEDRTRELADLLTELAIPGVIRRSRLDSNATYALVVADGDASVLTVVDRFHPTLLFARVDVSVLDDRLTALDTDWEQPAAEDPRIDGIAWMTGETDDFIAILGSRFEMPFDVADAEQGARVVAPSRSDDNDAALERGVWAMTDGVALWRSGSESAAAFVRKRRAYTLAWKTPWTMVDPSRPGQRLNDGRPLVEVLSELTTDDPDLAAWNDRFRLDAEQSEALRTLSRRAPGAGIVQELAAILRLPDELLLMADPQTERSGLGGFSAIEPQNARTQFRDAMRSIRPDEARADGFRFRHPRMWLTLALVVIGALMTYSIGGLIAGRGISAALPGAIGLVWAASLVVDGAFRRAWRRDEQEARAVAEATQAD